MRVLYEPNILVDSFLSSFFHYQSEQHVLTRLTQGYLRAYLADEDTSANPPTPSQIPTS